MEKMNVYDTMALIIHNNDNSIKGRTVIQKLVYFGSMIIPKIDIKPHLHYFYGPFSVEVASAMEEMVAFSYLNEIRRAEFYATYEYELTQKGIKYAKKVSEQYPVESENIKKIVGTCKKFCELKSSPISYAAKVYYVLNADESRNGDYTTDDIRRVAEDFDWDISEDDAEQGISLLQKLDLANAS